MTPINPTDLTQGQGQLNPAMPTQNGQARTGGQSVQGSQTSNRGNAASVNTNGPMTIGTNGHEHNGIRSGEQFYAGSSMGQPPAQMISLPSYIGRLHHSGSNGQSSQGIPVSQSSPAGIRAWPGQNTPPNSSPTKPEHKELLLKFCRATPNNSRGCANQHMSTGQSGQTANAPRDGTHEQALARLQTSSGPVPSRPHPLIRHEQAFPSSPLRQCTSATQGTPPLQQTPRYTAPARRSEATNGANGAVIAGTAQDFYSGTAQDFYYRAGLTSSQSDGNMGSILAAKTNAPVSQQMAIGSLARKINSTDGRNVISRGLQFTPPREAIKQCRSEELSSMIGSNGQPDQGKILNEDEFPFQPIYHGAENRLRASGVVKILNAPYDVTRAQVFGMAGATARILADTMEPVHITIERNTGKTADIFVELETPADAVSFINRFNPIAPRGRTAKLGDRPVEIQISSQQELMGAVLPSARGVRWLSGPPFVDLTTNSEFGWENFTGFTTKEELNVLCKHSITKPGYEERPYECLISTITKFPWYCAHLITIATRSHIYESYFLLLKTMVQFLAKNPNHARVTPELLKRMVTAAMLCPGFTCLQKDNVAHLVGMPDLDARQFNLPRFPGLWRHLYAVGPKPGRPLDVLEWYIAVIREETNECVGCLNMIQKQRFQSKMSQTSDYWGYFWKELDYPVGPDFDTMTLAQAYEKELGTIEKIIKRAMLGGETDSYYLGPEAPSHANENQPRSTLRLRY
ncbi:hypothetical protein F4778DRAFT_779668 [Xylariomycetidae sp. FL2044]|nr:hypothetical protein F4778DRAFT_779668 [Xylariomycetidae sp. FL2044]